MVCSVLCFVVVVSCGICFDISKKSAALHLQI